MTREQEGDHLKRLAQAHVVGQDCAEAKVRQRGEPLEALALIGAQHPAQALGLDEVGVGDRVELTDDGAEALVAVEAHAVGALEDGVDEQRTVERDARGALGELLGADAQAACQFDKGLKAASKLHDVAVGQAHVALTALVGVEVVLQLAGGEVGGVDRDVEQARAQRGLHTHIGHAAHVD